MLRLMDWKKSIADLQNAGMTQPQIAIACGCQQSTISMLATGKTTEPRDSLGQALRQLLVNKGIGFAEAPSRAAAAPALARPGAALVIPAHVAARGLAAADDLDLVERRTQSVPGSYARRAGDRAAVKGGV